jgi:hypothetical protein
LKTIPSIFLIGVLVLYASYYASIFPLPKSDIEKNETQGLFHYVQTETKPDDVIAFYRPRILALFTNRKSAAIAVPAPNGDTFGRMKELGIDTVIVRLNYTDENQTQLFQLIKDNPLKFKLLYENPDFRVFQVTY